MKKITLLIIIIAFTTIIGCNPDENQNKTLLPVITGKTGEVVVVIDKDKLPKTSKALTEIFSEEYPMLPQYEPIFTYVPIPHNAFTNIFKTHRNLIIINIKKSIPEDSIKLFLKKNIWAAPQIILQAYAPNDSIMQKLLLENKNYIINIINEWELKRIKDTYKKNIEKNVLSKIENKFGIYLSVPKGFNINIDTTNFMWISRETTELSQGVIIFQYKYKDTSDFSIDSLIMKQNIFLRNFIKGPTFGSWMTIEKRIKPEINYFTTNNIFKAKIRGLWKVENDFMGGPFLSVSFTDKQRKKILTIFGYVYAPKYNKREYIRQIEAILSTATPLR